jgi:hypothetical protein
MPRRGWVACGLSVLCTALASRDGRIGWTVTVAVTTGLLAGLVVVHPPERSGDDREDRQQAEVERILARYWADYERRSARDRDAQRGA